MDEVIRNEGLAESLVVTARQDVVRRELALPRVLATMDDVCAYVMTEREREDS